MRFQIKKLLEGNDPADLIEQSMYCFGSSDGGAGGTGDDSHSMGIDDSVADQSAVSGDTSSVGDDSDDDSTGISSDTANTSVEVDDFSLATVSLPNTSISTISPEAMASIGTTGYSPDSVTGFGQQNIGKDVSDYTTADQMTSLSPSINNPISNLLTHIGLPTTQNQINQGYTPTYSGGQVTGTTGFGIGMGMPSNNQNMTGSGLAVSGYAPFSSTQPSVDYGNYGDIGGNESEPIKPATTNPVSGQPICPDGYRFDDDLQACRLDTTRPNRQNNPNPFPANEAYYRATILDKAPMNVPSGFDFNKANQNFVSQFAYRPSAYQNQMGLSGFTPFRRS